MTLDVPEPLSRRLKARAASEGLELKDLVTSALAAYLSNPQKQIVRKSAKPCPFPLVRGKGGPLMKRMDNEIIASILKM